MSKLLSKPLYASNIPASNNISNCYMLAIDIDNPVKWCPVCNGKKFAFIPSLNKYKDIECPYCAGQGAVKICKCNRPMPLWQEKCYDCILRLSELEEELENKEE